MSQTRRPFKKYGHKPFRREPPVSMEDRIKSFVIRNSRNGFFTRLKTLSFKFEITEDEAWSITGSLLSDNVLEVFHDENGEVKLCENGKSLEVEQKELVRRRQKRTYKKN